MTLCTVENNCIVSHLKKHTTLVFHFFLSIQTRTRINQISRNENINMIDHKLIKYSSGEQLHKTAL